MIMLRQVADTLSRLREEKPLILSLTNSVVQPLTANLLLAIGAIPAMLQDGGEAAEMIRACAQALLINPGTLNLSQAHAMRLAVRAASSRNIPWVLDPVAAGLLRFRTELCRELLETPPAIIRGNASEILALAGTDVTGRGPESNHSSESALHAARLLASRTGAAVLVTGATDYATDGTHTVAVRNGHPLMTRVTGVGCAMGALAAALAACTPSRLIAAVSTATIWGIIGERAASAAPRPGSFATALLDEADALTPNDVLKNARIDL